MTEPLYLRGRLRSLAFHGDQVYVYLPDGRPVAVFPVADLSRVGVSISPDGSYFRYCAWFRSAETVIEGLALQRNPYIVDVDLSRADELAPFATALGAAVFEQRRVSAPGPLPPAAGDRSDLTDAMAKLQEEGADPDTLARYVPAVSDYLRNDEAVLAVADTRLDDVPFILLVMTTLRTMFLSLNAALAYDIGHDCIRNFAAKDVDGATYLIFDSVSTPLQFRIWGRGLAERLADLGNAALHTLVCDGAVRPGEPTTVESFEAYELLIERHRLQMLTSEQFDWQMAGVLGSARED